MHFSLHKIPPFFPINQVVYNVDSYTTAIARGKPRLIGLELDFLKHSLWFCGLNKSDLSHLVAGVVQSTVIT